MYTFKAANEKLSRVSICTNLPFTRSLIKCWRLEKREGLEISWAFSQNLAGRWHFEVEIFQSLLERCLWTMEMRNGLEILRVPVEFNLFGAAKVFSSWSKLIWNFWKLRLELLNSLEYFDAVVEQLKVFIYMNVERTEVLVGLLYFRVIHAASARLVIKRRHNFIVDERREHLRF